MKKSWPRFLRDQRGSTFLTALLVTGGVLLASYSAFQRFGDTKNSFRMARVRSLMGVTEQQLRARALLPDAYTGCTGAASTCRVNDAFFADLASRSVAGANCPPGRSNCGIRTQILPFQAGTKTFQAEISYEGTEVRPKSTRVSVVVPLEVLQADVFHCGLIDPGKPIFAGLDPSSSAPVCVGFNSCGPGQFVHEIHPSRHSLSCKSLPRDISCPNQQLISAFNWNGGSLQHSCASLPNPPYDLGPTIPPVKPPKCEPGQPCCTAEQLAKAIASMIKDEPLIAHNDMAVHCVDAAVPLWTDNLPSGPMQAMRFMNTCAKRWCQQKLGFYTGRGTELSGSHISVQCRQATPPPGTPAACVKLLEAAPPVKTTPTIREEVVAEACLEPGQTVADIVPKPGNYESHVRFFNTCGNRYCTKKGFSSGRVVEYFNHETNVECYDAKVEGDGLSETMKVFNPSPMEIAVACKDSPDHDPALSLPSADPYRFVNTCGNRYCKKQEGFTWGEVKEYDATSTIVNCYRSGG